MSSIKVSKSSHLCCYLELRGQGEVAGGPSTKNCFIVFLDIGSHGGLRTFYGIEKYCSNSEISRFQNRDYHRLTLRKLAISSIISKCNFLTLKPIFSHNFHPNVLKLSRDTQWGHTKKSSAQFFFSFGGPIY